MNDTKAQVFSSGGGTQSACIAALIVNGRLPKPDFAVIVDTERERAAVWDYHDSVIAPALASVGVAIHRVPKSKYATIDLITGADRDTIAIPGYSSQVEGSVGKMPSFCSSEWKVRVLHRFLKAECGVPTSKTRRWIGFSVDEMRRAVRMMKGADYKRDRVWFPLIHGIPMRRQEAIREVLSMGWPMPPRSACWMCGNHADSEWLDMKLNSPLEFQKAAELEKEIQVIDPFMWLHSSCVPLADVDFSGTPKGDEERQCDSGGCFI